jgi:hypothetical protein
MLGTVEEAMSQVIDWWVDLPPSMKEAINQFRTQLGAAIDSVEFVKGHSTERYTKLIMGKAVPDVRCSACEICWNVTQVGISCCYPHFERRIFNSDVRSTSAYRTD